ncbi:MAG: MATE family efflux transporter, partial [Oscillospiraceae bacterium]|nr:MATE family efflux transporter [Oscillospiraceae bacterium]
MPSNRSFFRMVCGFAVPIALQSMLQASFSIVDQIMIGQLGSVSVAGVGLAARFSSMYTFMVSAVGTVAGIMISQYLGQRNHREIRRSFWVNLLLAAAMAAVFMLVGVVIPNRIMGLYATDTDTVQAA